MNLQPFFNRLYWIVVLVLIILCFVVFSPGQVSPVLSGVTATNLQQVLVLLGLGGLPGVLLWSNRQVKRLKDLPSKDDRSTRYRMILYVRLAVYTLIAFYTLLVQYLTQMKGALMFMMVVFVLFAFVWPTKARFETELTELDTTDEEERVSEGEQEEK